MTSKKLGKSISAYVLIIVLIIGSFSAVDQNEKSTNNQLFEDNSDILPKMFSQRNSNDWSASASAANPAVLNSIDSSPSNELVVAGIISGSTTMSMGSASITSGQYIEPWIAKSDVNGNWQWIEQVSITGASQYAEATINDIAVASNGDIFATGMFYDTISFGPITLTSTGYWDCWTAKINTNGQWQWACLLYTSPSPRD